jgi:hypothetical protein
LHLHQGKTKQFTPRKNQALPWREPKEKPKEHIKQKNPNQFEIKDL